MIDLNSIDLRTIDINSIDLQPIDLFRVNGGSAYIEVQQSEIDDLVSFYESTDGDNWINNFGWLTDTMVKNWYGVDVRNGSVSRVYLNNAQIYAVDYTATIPSLELFLTSDAQGFKTENNTALYVQD